jgi:ubiquinone/menaquinone biosynthesis C-methylase UbiE
MLNSFENPALVEGYEAWYKTTGRRTDRQEKALLQRLLVDFPAVHTLLEVGCGTGHFTRWFQERDLQAVGLDVSKPMLAEAVKLGGPQFVHGNALSLPFSNNTLDIVALKTGLTDRTRRL